jgi:hypothetical protein
VQLKYATVNPSFKKGDTRKSQFANYRLISLLTENQHVEAHHVLVPQKHEFHKGLSTDKAACKFTNSIFKAWNRKMYVSCIFCELVEAFDCVQSQALAVEPELLQHTG